MTLVRWRSLVLLAVWLGTLAGLRGGDWPHPRGVAWDGHAATTEVQLPWPAAGPPRLWQRGLGQGYSGFVVAGQRAFTQLQNRAGEFVVGLDLHTGRLIWETRYAPAQGADAVYPGPYATPVIAGERLYFAGSRGLIGCVRLSDGQSLWTYDLVGRDHITLAGFGYAATPLVFNNTVFAPAGGPQRAMIALDAGNGTRRWQAGSEAPAYAGAIPVKVGDRWQIVAFYEHGTVAFDPATGAVLWRDELPENYAPQAAWPVYDAPWLLRGMTFRRGARTLKLIGTPEPQAQLAWENRRLSNDILSSVAVGGCIYGFDIHEDQSGIAGDNRGDFVCLELSSGRELWRAGGTGQAAAMVCGERLLLVNERGTLIVLAATPAAYRELARTELLANDRCWAPPALADGYLLIRGKSSAACFYVGDPRSAGVRPGLAEWLTQNLTYRLRSLFAPVRDESFTAPGWPRLATWFAAGFLLLAGAAGIFLAFRRLSGCWSWSIIFALALAGGLLGVPLGTRLLHRLVFTWPLVLFQVYFLTMLVGARAAGPAAPAGARWLARACLVAFVVFAVAYGIVCRAVDFPVGLGFLVGLPFAWPWARRATRAVLQHRSRMAAWGWLLIGFAAYFWSSAAFVVWKTQW